ncbi:alpha/beta hydrolase [Paenibacillus chartarius]|uniref:Alpha/beta hydrolase n=1 Tax=Paenibacillus chartarius TaxID=747481 RepID=A0ABV6DPQ9_9BACL
MAWLHVRYHSEVLRMPVSMEVLIPQPGHTREAGSFRGPYPALYLLHDMGGGPTSWLRRTSVERYAEERSLAVVLPAGHRGWYTDMERGRDYFRFLTAELPLLCESMFPLSSCREDRFIAGAGAGGYGALKAGLLAADTFGLAASFSGDLDVLRVYEELEPITAENIFGSGEQLPGSGHDLFAAVRRLAQSGGQRPDMRMWCGSGDRRYGEHIRFAAHAAELGLPVSFNAVQGGCGGWSDWDEWTRQFVAGLPLPMPADKKGA